MREPAGFPALGAQRHQLVEGRDRLAVLQQHGPSTAGRNSTQGSSSTNDGATSYSACSSAIGRRLVALDRRAGFGDAGLAQGLDVALPAVRLLVIASAGCVQLQRGQLRPGEFPAHQ